MTGLTLTWLRHEFRLSARDAASMLQGGRKARFSALIVAILLAALLHLAAWATVRSFATVGAEPEIRTLVVITTGLVFSASLFLSQAIESVTRVLYGRGDLDLILSSPVPARRVLAIRVASVGVSIGGMTLFVAGPFANVLAYLGGARWLGIYPAAFAVGLAMTALGLLITLALLRFAGPARTRLAAQIVAAIIGSAFAIGLQVAAIVEFGEISRFAIVASDAVLAIAPGPESLLWLPARAATGNPAAALAVVLVGLAGFAGTLLACAASLERAAYATAGVAGPARQAHRGGTLETKTAGAALRRKEWRLLSRDPWLVSQTLMQVLYLVPPAVLLWHSYGEGAARLAILVPILVMTGGQLAGGLAWLAISGEDAPDLVATAPVPQRQIVGAKLLSVLGVVGAIMVPFGLALAVFSPWIAAVVTVGVATAGASAFLIQFWFRQPGRRSHFRRRQTASRIATFAEAFSSILWAATAALAAALTPVAIPVGLLALAGLFGARLLSPRHAT